MRRGALARCLAIPCLAGCIGSTGYAMATIAGLVPPIPFAWQFGAWVGLILLVLPLSHDFLRPSGYAGMRDVRMTLHRDGFRAALTGPFAELGRPRRRRYRHALRQPHVFLMLCLGVVSVAGKLLWPFGFWIVAVMLVRYAAWEGDAIATWIDGEIGTRPRLRRNRRRDWTRSA